MYIYRRAARANQSLEFSSSTIVQLYMPYVNFGSWGSVVCDEFSKTSVQEMRVASHAVASTCGRVLAAVTLQHVPAFM